ncbi:MAG: 2-oxo-4-hydroxy-4-carboxy-5-ureidoimidazoline decarboxylase [Corynebacterium sp.]|nr:2-oxo-4-hydroxy-4-carboxy-5-ureidoimidazoline decarboxylase [Corynebacterium sp.]
MSTAQLSSSPSDIVPGNVFPQDRVEGNLARLQALDATTAAELFSNMFASATLGNAFVGAFPLSNTEQAMQALAAVHQQASQEQLRAAIMAHPPIGQAVAPGSRSAHEQQVAQQDVVTLRKIQHLNDLYQQRFGYVFLIKAAGLSATEILDQLQQRLHNDPASEWEIACQEFLAINQYRLAQFLALPQT